MIPAGIELIEGISAAQLSIYNKVLIRIIGDTTDCDDVINKYWL